MVTQHLSSEVAQQSLPWPPPFAAATWHWQRPQPAPPSSNKEEQEFIPPDLFF